MQSIGMPTFQQTFSRCSFPEGVLSVLGAYPAQVRVHKAQRKMEVRVFGPETDPVVLEGARSGLISAFRLNDAEVQVVLPEKPEKEPAAVPPPAPAAEPADSGQGGEAKVEFLTRPKKIRHPPKAQALGLAIEKGTHLKGKDVKTSLPHAARKRRKKSRRSRRGARQKTGALHKRRRGPQKSPTGKTQ